jgi:hypothetical protein
MDRIISDKRTDGSDMTGKLLKESISFGSSSSNTGATGSA